MPFSLSNLKFNIDTNSCNIQNIQEFSYLVWKVLLVEDFRKTKAEVEV